MSLKHHLNKDTRWHGNCYISGMNNELIKKITQTLESLKTKVDTEDLKKINDLLDEIHTANVKRVGTETSQLVNDLLTKTHGKN